MSELLRLNGICKVYDKGMDESVVLDDLSFAVSEREFICLLGASGCGKSTLMRILGGVEKPTLGTIEYKGETFKKGIPVNKLRHFGSVFQNNAMLDWRTVRGNMRINLEIFRLRGEEWERRIDDLLEMVGLSEFQNIYPYELSGGMRQRVGIGRALVHDPEILLFDQPFGALDAITRRMLSYEVLHIWEKTQKTIFMVTNNVDEALLLATRILVMDKTGKIVFDFPNTVPTEARNENIHLDERFNELRTQVNTVVRAS